MKVIFPPKKFQSTYALRGAGFGLVLSVVLYMMYYVSSGSVALISDSFIWLFLLGITSFIWLISYVSIGALLPFVVTANEQTDPSLWVIMISPVLFYAVAFWLIGSLIQFFKKVRL
jgi:hypothetical protein